MMTELTDLIKIIELTIVLAGFAAAFVLFYRLPVLPAKGSDAGSFLPVSVIIPARNEESCLPLLLGDLNRQTLRPYEILCVDDDSEDGTAKAALSGGARLISLRGSPEGQTGKTRACQNGADAAEGELLLFLDADVRLGPDSLKKLMRIYSDTGCALSVQPFHKTERIYEQFSLLFNLVLIAANGTALPVPKSVGLYGPVILISKSDYGKAGGHKSVCGCIAEDVALGLRLKKCGIPYRLYTGGGDISFRMYGSGFRALLEGWVKNVAAGASKTPPLIFAMVFFWIASLTSVPIQLTEALLASDMPLTGLYSLLYTAWAAGLTVLSGRIGRFQRWASVLFPLLLPVFFFVFTVSSFKKIFGLKVTWKGRGIDLQKKP